MSNDPKVPVLTDGVVTLRAHTTDDVDAVTEMCRDPEFGRWTTVPMPYERDNAVRFVTEIVPAGWREHTSFGWAIEASDDDGRSRFAGNVDLRTDPRPDIGFGLHPWARGRGVMARAVRLATRWGFDTLGMPLVHWECHTGNFASWRVAWSCGFAFQATIPGYSPQRGELRDAWLAVLRADDEQVPRTRWLPVPVLEGARVRLRAHTEADYGAHRGGLQRSGDPLLAAGVARPVHAGHGPRLRAVLPARGVAGPEGDLGRGRPRHRPAARQRRAVRPGRHRCVPATARWATGRTPTPGDAAP